MSTEIEVIEDVVEVPELKPTLGEDGVTDTTDWKALAEANRELALKNQGIANRFKTKFEKTKTEPKAEPVTKKEKKSDELDYGQKAFLVANGVKGSKEIALAKSIMEASGKTLDEVLENKYFQSELKDLRDAEATVNATPKSGKRGTQPSGNTVEYWSEKYDSGTQLNDIPEDMQLKVLNAKIAREKSAGSNFSPNPIVG